MECIACGKPGTLEPTDALDSPLILLAETENGEMMCIACYAESESICLHCGNEDGLFPDTSCKAEPWFCRDCLDLSYRIHMFSCYSDGCVTVEEFAEECQRDLEGEQHGDYPERSREDKRC